MMDPKIQTQQIRTRHCHRGGLHIPHPQSPTELPHLFPLRHCHSPLPFLSRRVEISRKPQLSNSTKTKTTMSLLALNPTPISCNFPSLPKSPGYPPSLSISTTRPSPLPNPSVPLRHPALSVFRWRGILLPRRGASARDSPGDPVVEEEGLPDVERRRSGGGGGGVTDWSTSVLLFGFYAAILYYVFQLAPNQTPSRDLYFVQKLLNLKGDDGFKMNEVLVALWYIMGLWPLLYSMLLLPTGRSSSTKIPISPFVMLSFFFGAYALIPYFILWKPPPPPVEEEEIGAWPLNFLESKITAGISFAAGLGLIVYAGLASGDSWKEFYQYFRESKLVHATSLDFSLLTAFSAFWVYNDMTARRWYNRGSWLLPLALVPFVGPALYLLLRPSLSALPSVPSSVREED